MELINALGVDLKILIAQLINFAVLLFVLYEFAYKPILKFLDERQGKIAQGIEDAQKATKKLEEIEIKEKDVIKNAKKEAVKIIDQAKKDADEKRKEMIAKAKEEIKLVIDDEKLKIKAEKQESLNQIKKEVSGLVMIAVEKVINEKIDNAKDKKIIEKIIKEN